MPEPIPPAAAAFRAGAAECASAARPSAARRLARRFLRPLGRVLGRPCGGRLRHAALGGAVLAAVVGASAGRAHDWPSPSPAASRPAVAPLPAADPAWSGTLWPGPAAGEPAAPSARDCHRAPRTIDLPGRPMPAGQGRPEGADERAALPAAAERAADARLERRREGAPGKSMRGESSAGAPAAAVAAPPQLAAAPSTASPAPAGPAAEPVAEAVTAGVVDDNADFGRYLDFRSRHADLPARPMDVTERYRLVVHDADGRPVPDAQVRVLAEGRVLPLWARTDAGGQAWLHPRVAAAGSDPLTQPAAWPSPALPAWLEVQVRKGDGDQALHGSALLQRGQRHDLQVRLDGRAAPGPARLDLVFLVDATGSMADEIHKLAASMRAMADQIASLPSRPDLCVGLVAYRDQGDAFFVRAQDFSDDLGAVQRSLAALRAGGGGDYPEALNEGLHTAVHRLSWRGDGATRLVVLVADAPPHVGERAVPGQPRYDHDLQAALARGIKLFAVGASGLDPLGETVFRQAAQYTGGRFVFLTYARAGDPSSGPGRETLHEVENYSVESLDRLVVRLVREELARRPT